MNSSLILVPFLVFAIGVFGSDEQISVSVTEGDSVTLHTGVSEIQSKDVIEWRLAGNRVARISSSEPSIDKAFVNRLQLDSQTGDLTIPTINTTDSGDYTLKIRRSSRSSDMTFSVSVSADEAKPVSVMEGDSVTLRTDPTYTQRYDVIQWRFGQQKSLVAEINRTAGIFNIYDGPDGRFRDRLQLDHQTGSLIITNIGTTHSGLYEADIISTSSRYTIHHTQSFSVTVRADVESMSVLKGGSVTLRTSLTRTQSIEQIRWTFGDDGKLIADLNGPVNKKWNNIGLNNQTGDLTISNIQTDQYGDYKVQINTRTMTLHRKYQIIGE
uniref:Ig-like domain-containing protein n=1 Tax=Cyprinus carpio TaxID=7962 RepID=A0A8C1V6J2_CYPCA